MFSIADLHCDLLCYLANDPLRTINDLQVRCSYPQLKEGKVEWQVFPIFTPTEKGSVLSGAKQLDHFQKLAPGSFKAYLAVENASAFCEEGESLDEGLQRIDALLEQKPVYMSLTWNGENRFGGGAGSTAGLKSDGKVLLRKLDGSQTALDLSHASDALALDAFNFIDREKLKVRVMASHSNFRAIRNLPRNLPDELAKEIFNRGGLIGLNFVRLFIGDTLKDYARQLEHGLKLGSENQIALGADFFYGEDVPADQRKAPDVYWFPEVAHAGCYKKVFTIWQNELALSDVTLSKIAHQNLLSWLSI